MKEGLHVLATAAAVPKLVERLLPAGIVPAVRLHREASETIRTARSNARSANVGGIPVGQTDRCVFRLRISINA